MLVEEGPDVGAGDVQGPGSGQAGAGVDAELIGQQPQVGEGGVDRTGHQKPPFPAGQFGIDTGAGLRGARSLDITRAYVRAFFDQHLRGEPQALLDQPSPRYPEVTQAETRA